MKSFRDPLPDGQGTLWSGVRAPRESRLKNGVITWSLGKPIAFVLKLDKIWVGKVQTIHGSWIEGAETGTPDCSGHVRAAARWYRGARVVVECKRDRYEKLTPEQIEYMTDVIESGGIAIEGRNVNQVEHEFLEAIGMRRSECGRFLEEDDRIRFPVAPRHPVLGQVWRPPC